jgi:hypothetical protein
MKGMARRVWGIVLLAIGVMALLQAIEVFKFGLAVWPVLLVLLGGALVWGSFYRWFCSWFQLGLGLWVGVIGLFEILSNAGAVLITGGDIARHGWPLLLVALGLSILFGDRACFSGWRRRKPDPEHPRRWSAEQGRRHHIGDLYRGRELWILDGDLDLQHGIGDVVLDLTTAEISGGTHHITVKVGVGELLIRVPGNVNATVDASLSIGELQVLGERRSGIGGMALREELRVEGAAAELKIEARLGIGELTVLLAPASSGGAR